MSRKAVQEKLKRHDKCQFFKTTLLFLGSSLQFFNCMGSSNVTGASIVTLAKSCPDLLLLDIGYCIHLESSEFQRELHSLLPNCHIVTSLNGS